MTPDTNFLWRLAIAFGLVAGINADAGGLISLTVSVFQMAIANPGESAALASASAAMAWLSLKS